MQGKCLINRRILTGLAASVALKNCKYQLQNFELFTVLCTGSNWNPILAQDGRPANGSDIKLCRGFFTGFFAIIRQKLENARRFGTCFQPGTRRIAYSSHFAGLN